MINLTLFRFRFRSLFVINNKRIEVFIKKNVIKIFLAVFLLVVVMGECKCLLSVSDDIVYLFTYQECLIYLFSQHQVHHNPAPELHRGEHISCISAKNRKTQDQFPVAGRKDENKKMSHLFATIPSFLLVIDISNQNFSIWHLKNIIG